MPRTDSRGGPQTRERISIVATRLFLERGFDAVTVAEVAREAGVSSVTVFNHFPRKEDLMFDRAGEAADLVRAAVRNRAPDVDVLASLRRTVLSLLDDRHGLSGIADASAPFYRTVAASPALIARAREISANIQRALAEELARDKTFAGDGAFLAAFFVSGYSTVLTENARRFIAGEPSSALADDTRARLDQLFEALRGGVSPSAEGRAQH